MMLYTKIDIPRSPVRFAYEHRTMLFGSCFAESIGKRLSGSLFRAEINPFGTLYNPASVAMAIERLIEGMTFTSDDLFQHEGLYHSFFHHSSFSSVSADECLQQINERLQQAAVMLSSADRIIITWGTAYVYRLKGTGQTVANCHKLPEKYFERARLSVEEIVSLWEPLIAKLQKKHPSLQWLFTVSPIRH